jgi:hypothetical protein
MSERTTKPRLLLAVPAALAALGCVAVSAPPASAVHERVTTNTQKTQTSGCPCTLPDEYDGTYYLRDSGGMGAKLRIYSKGRLAGKAEFHPQGEKLWIYDTLANDDAIYYQIRWGTAKLVFKVPSGKKYATIDLDIAEGTPVTVTAWDNRSATSGKVSNYLGSVIGRA